jgi:DNA-directed RNA polymerase
LEKLPRVFTVEDGPREDDNKGEDKFITLTEEAQAYTEKFVAQMILRNPVWLPRSEAPKPWTGWNTGGARDKRLARSLSVVRGHQNLTKEAVRQAIRNGKMKPALDALNALQAVPWAINERVLWLMLVCNANGIEVTGLPTRSVLSLLARQLVTLSNKRNRVMVPHQESKK